ncbi:hypothetical protein BGZ80_002076 [Entomortierella chlamydospora]|uniref:Uncharacterized protein n=1 Tax=Entomortierella chlamydospora TaxID=101097 RepID=A0A9P6N1Q2_9FUNG|nr:hypothetical protein BGZ79_009814 [Entomortierella chlamydospora]KAG0021609.1 hypothetical protein BGZ80_002076 [Entomortierella chlamydospora]
MAEDQTAPRKRIRGERIVWTPEEDEFLRKAVQKYGDKTEKWAKIAACVPGRTNKNCRKRWFHSLDPSLKKGGWTEEEDHLLRTGVEMFRGQWSKIAERIQGRTDDQCAKRWRESLDPDIDRAAWTPEDDNLLLQKFEEYGTQWQKIAALSFPGRPGLHCRNRWRKIQRSLNHMQRANKRRRNQFDIKDGTSSWTQSSDIHMEQDDGSGNQSGGGQKLSSEDALLQESYLDDDCGLLEDSVDNGDGKNDSNSDEERPYGCAIPDCSFESSSPSLLFYHFKASHHGTTVLKPFRCTMPGCEDRKRYKNINGLQYHVNHAKNTPGHSGHGSSNQELEQNAKASSATPVEENAPSPGSDALSPFLATVANPVSTPRSSIPTPAEIQSLILPAIPQSIVTHQAFNIPHTPESLEEPVMSSPVSRDTALSQARSTTLQCPELGCGQIFHALGSLTSHMANNHGHQSMTMESNDATYGRDSIAIPENNFNNVGTDMDMDMAYLASEHPSPMVENGNNMLLMDDAELQAHFDRLTRNQEAMSLDSNTISGIPTTADQELDILAMNKLLFANHISYMLNTAINSNSFSNRIHFGTHINVSADDPFTLPSTPVTSANVSPRMSAAAINIPADARTDSEPIPFRNRELAATPFAAGATFANTGTAVPTVTKKFPCLANECPKSYGSSSAMWTHMKNEHPGTYVKPARGKSASANAGYNANINNGSGLFMADESRALANFGTSSSPSSATMPTPESLVSPGSPESATSTISWMHAMNGNNANEELQTDRGHGAIKQQRQSRKFDDQEKPFKCLVPGCGKGYRNINGLKNHLLQAHGSTPKKNGGS